MSEVERDPYAITCVGMPTPKELEEGNQRERKRVALWVWNDDWYESQQLLRPILAQAYEELMQREPWMRKYFNKQ